MENKERNQIILVSALLGLGVLSGYFNGLIFPQMREGERLRKASVDRAERVGTKESQLRKLRMAQTADLVNADLDARVEKLIATVPTSPWVNCPEAFSKLSERYGVKPPKFALAMILPFKGLGNSLTDVWRLEFPETSALALGSALADFENQFPLGQVTSVSLIRNLGSQSVRAEFSFHVVVSQ